LEKGDDLISDIPADRWDWRAIYGDPLTEPTKTNIKWGGFMPVIDTFDADFFGISPREAVIMDPQQRIFLEIVWKTLEDAGYACKDLSGTNTGLFVGSGGSDYHDLLIKNQVEVQAHTATGMMHSVLANRVSYLLGLRGPSEPVETACSSSLVALHRAIGAIRAEDCTQAIVGGINLIVSPDLYVGLAKASMLCEDGRCKTFDSRANGYVRGEGIGTIFIKPLSAAARDRDQILAVVKGSAVNHGGNANSLTSPNLKAQAEVLVKAYSRAGIDPSSVGFIEAHGTGTALGDPIEINGLKKAFRQLYQDHQLPQPEKPHCYIGSVKTNIGHLELASGMAGLLKVLLAMRHKTIPANLHMREQNPYIQLDDSPFQLVPDTIPWPQLHDSKGNPLPRRAGVSSFGFGGVNAHVVLEEPESPRLEPIEDRDQLFLLSAKNEERLRVYVESLIAFLDHVVDDDREAKKLMARRLRSGLREELGNLIGVAAEDVDPSESLADLGIDGLLLTSLTNRIRDRFELELNADDLEGITTTTGLVEILTSRFQVQSLNKKHMLADMAFTSQLGRDAHACRLAVVCTGVDQLRSHLASWRRGKANPFVFHGPQPGQMDQGAALVSGDLKALAACWVGGERIDWQPLWQDQEARRISMPTYPFEPKPYWFKQRTTEISPPPILAQDGRLQLQSTAFYLKDHVIGGKAMLPGAMSLELLRQFSGCQAMTDILWRSPIRGDEQDLRIKVKDQQIAIVSAEGEHLAAEIHDLKNRPQALNLEAIRSKCDQQHEVVAFYKAYEQRGIHYGPACKSLTQITSGNGYVLAQIRLPQHLEASSFGMHPSLLDAAFHAAAAFETDSTKATFVPYALGAIHIYRNLPEHCLVVIKPEPDHPNTRATRHFRITLCDTDGEVLVELDKFSVRAMKPPKTKTSTKIRHPFIDTHRVIEHPFIDQHITS
jgi:polyketide synthase PksN